MGKCEILERQHPAVASFLENRVREKSSNVPSKAMYENICQYVAKLEEVSTFSTNTLQKCDTEMAKCSPAGVPKKGYKDELDFLSKNIRPRLIEIDTSIKEKAQQARG
ncbi:Hypothetical predicted protein [Paramuricea clavata]|uniref:Uncharacterized protein n=1 Tax=Paramuricea clavata TaxID=317549 RepID=A0A6S7FRJ1_PARCT|nr:Hypothetical predicted protein [Paramuricea clavata]